MSNSEYFDLQNKIYSMNEVCDEMDLVVDAFNHGHITSKELASAISGLTMLHKIKYLNMIQSYNTFFDLNDETENLPNWI
jgi:hypothetical protein